MKNAEFEVQRIQVLGEGTLERLRKEESMSEASKASNSTKIKMIKSHRNEENLENL